MTDPGVSQFTRVNVIERLTVNGQPITPGSGGFDPSENQIITGEWHFNLATNNVGYWSVANIDDPANNQASVNYTVTVFENPGISRNVVSGTVENDSTNGSSAFFTATSNLGVGGSFAAMGDFQGSQQILVSDDGENNQLISATTDGVINLQTNATNVTLSPISTGLDTWSSQNNLQFDINNDITLNSTAGNVRIFSSSEIETNSLTKTNFVNINSSQTAQPGQSLRANASGITVSIPNTGFGGERIRIACSDAAGCLITAQGNATVNVNSLADGEYVEFLLVIDGTGIRRWKGQAL